MDALVLDIAVQIMSALSMALLAWGGCLCLVPSSRGTEAAQQAEARLV